MSGLVGEIEKANKEYAKSFGRKGELSSRPRKRAAVLTCMDTRLVPSKFLGVEEGDLHVIRNAGGRASEDAIRSLLVSHKVLGTEEWFVIHHTDCGMYNATDEEINALFGVAAGDMEWLSVKDASSGVAEDVERLRSHPLVPKEIRIYGYMYDVKSGLLDRCAS